MGFFECFGERDPTSESNQQKQKGNKIVILVIGDSQVGKDCLISALCSQGHSEIPQTDQKERQIRYNEKILAFRRLHKSNPDFFKLNYEIYLNTADVVLLCVDVSNIQTIQSFSDNYFENILQFIKNKPTKQLRCILVLCKCDKQFRIKSEEDDIITKCKQLDIECIQVSSIKNIAIDTLFGLLTDYQKKNISQKTVSHQIQSLQNSKYMDAVSSLRDDSKMLTNTLNFTAGKNPGAISNQYFRQNNPSQNINQNINELEESKSSSQVLGGNTMQYQKDNMKDIQQYIRIIPHEKMFLKSRQLIDKGNFGTVYKIQYENEMCALKICKIEMNDESAMNRFQIIFAEAENMQNFMLNRSLRIMPLKGISFQVDIEKKNILIGYWMPLCKYSLKSLIKSQFSNIKVNDKIRYCLQITECLEIFEREKIQHMDLKPQNILLDQNDDIIVADLSMSKVFEQKQTQAFNMLGATAKYAHPAAIINQSLSPRFDIYSFGLIVLELFTGKSPWENIKRDDLIGIYEQILKDPIKMNPIRYHQENYPQETKNIEGKFSDVYDIIYMCCVSIFIPDQKDHISIKTIKDKFQNLKQTLNIE